MKRILAINYSQSGQLDEIIDNFTQALNNVEIHRVHVRPLNPYSFPWKTNNFYDPMPETVLEEPIPIADLQLKNDYDLIILGYQPWFLSPSLPTTSLLQDESFLKVLKNTPVFTIVGARNMWLNAHTSVVDRIMKNGGHIIGHLALVDRAPNLLSAVSIVHWMMTGKKTRKWGILPLPGVSEEDIKGSEKFGKLLNESIEKNDFNKLQDKVLKNDGLSIKTTILFIEGRAKKIFTIWAKLIKKKEANGKNRKLWIKLFRFYLNFALFVVATPLLIIYSLTFRPFTQKSIRAKKRHFAYLGIKA